MMGIAYVGRMQVVAKRTLKKFWELHADAEAPLNTWYGIVTKASWTTPQEVKAQFGTTVDFVSDNRAIFDIGGNKFRLVARIVYRFKAVQIKFVGTHKDYDKIDAETV